MTTPPRCPIGYELVVDVIIDGIRSTTPPRASFGAMVLIADVAREVASGHAPVAFVAGALCVMGRVDGIVWDHRLNVEA
jgi:hypothetical protein